jgi:hypothetical protein
MTALEKIFERRPGETERAWLRRLEREIADGRVVNDVVRAFLRGSITAKQREQLIQRAGRMINAKDRARTLELVRTLAAK